MPRVLKEACVVTGTYEDNNTGQTKSRYKNVGVIMEGENENGTYQFMLLDRSFNPAGINGKPGSDKVIVKLFDPKDNDRISDGRSSSHHDNQYDQRPEDEIAF